jgi:Phosphotransferase enzyme family
MEPPPPRIVTLVLVTPDGRLVGSLPPFEIDVPWWQEAGPVVRAAREHHGVDVTVLRLLDSERPTPHGGRVTYLAEVAEPVAAAPWAGSLDDHPLRAPWARPGGPRGDLEWADARLAERGLRRSGPAEQVRSWNLSSLWRLPLDGGSAWLKAVPPFFAHEGPILERLAGAPVPVVLAQHDRRILMPEISGDDLYDASLPRLLEMVGVLVDLQRAWIGRTDDLHAVGLPDWRGPSLAPMIASVVERTAGELTAVDRHTLAAFVEGLEPRFAAIAACGLPDTLVHGDFHPGNTRGTEATLVLLDWGDCGTGHPLLDEPAFLDRIPEAAVAPVRERWHAAWRAAVPGSDPARASLLLAPVAAARQAVIYRAFLDGIEPSEHPYHRADPADWLGRTAALLRSGPGE